MKVKITLLGIRCWCSEGPDPGIRPHLDNLILWWNGETYEMDNGDIIPEIMKTSPSHHHHTKLSLSAQHLDFNQSLDFLPPSPLTGNWSKHARIWLSHHQSQMMEELTLKAIHGVFPVPRWVMWAVDSEYSAVCWTLDPHGVCILM